MGDGADTWWAMDHKSDDLMRLIEDHGQVECVLEHKNALHAFGSFIVCSIDGHVRNDNTLKLSWPIPLLE